MPGLSELRVLIVGAGVAGPVLAYWLVKAGATNITIVERASSGGSKLGQGIDITGPALRIVEKMGVEKSIREKVTGEKGFAILNDNCETIALFEGGGITRDIEIMRGDLVQIFTDAAQRCEKIIEIEGETRLQVNFDNGDQAEYDIVVGADGMRSRTRNMIFGSEKSQDGIKWRDQNIAYFEIPRDKSDWPYSRWQNFTGSRNLLVRPRGQDTSTAYFSVIGKSAYFKSVLTNGDRKKQKEAIAEIFSDLGGLAPRCIEGMLTAENFYFEQLAQVKLDKWSRNRCVLLGDAAYCPAPITGMGTALAIMGAYVLAGELSLSPTDATAAFNNYEERLRDYVSKAQAIPLFGQVPRLVHPSSAWGVWFLRKFTGLLSSSGIWKLLGMGGGADFEYPAYNFGEETEKV